MQIRPPPPTCRDSVPPQTGGAVVLYTLRLIITGTVCDRNVPILQMRKLRPGELLRNTEEQQKAVTPADAFPTVPISGTSQTRWR